MLSFMRRSNPVESTLCNPATMKALYAYKGLPRGLWTSNGAYDAETHDEGPWQAAAQHG